MTLDETLGSGQAGHNSDHAALRAEAAARGVTIAALTPGVSSVLDHALVHQALAVNHNLIGAATVLPETVAYNNQLSTHQVLHKAYNLRTVGTLALVTPSVVHATAGVPAALPVGAPGAIINLPPQPASVMYGDPIVTSLIDDYAYPGGMVIGGRSSYSNAAFQGVSAAGGHFLIYIDVLVWNAFGRYHNLLFNASAYGSAVPKWPGPISANSTGDLADFRTTSPMFTEGKLEAILELAVAENPHMAGFFMDDVGSKSWYPNFDWDTFGATNQQNYRDGAIAVCQAARNVCNRHNLFFIVNGTWHAGTLPASGGGYPTMGTNGISLAEGGVVEHHDGSSSFWGPYMDEATSQWGDASPITGGKPFCLVIATTSAGTTEYRTNNKAAWVTAAQPSSNYGGVAPWGTVGDFHVTGLPSHATSSGSATVTPAAVHGAITVSAPAVTTGGGTTVTASAVSRTVAVPAPSVATGALTVTLKASGVVDEVTTSIAASEVLAPISFAANSYVLIVLGGIQSYVSAVTTDLRASASGLTFTERAGATQAVVDKAWMRILSAPHTAGGSTTITIDSNTRKVYGISYAVYQITGHNVSTPFGAVAQATQQAILTGSYSITLGSAPASSSMVIAAFTADTNPGLNIVDVGTGWTEDVELDSTGANFGVLQTQRRTGSTSTTVTWNDIRAGASVALFSTAACAVEIQAP